MNGGGALAGDMEGEIRRSLVFAPRKGCAVFNGAPQRLKRKSEGKRGAKMTSTPR